jgi:2-polyprenyl-3-methyl-5-hydroxy-6-metoxy-1,4-benzoquinol methylase
MIMQPVCPFCFSGECEISYLPKTYFNNKLFSYFRCKTCELHYVSPLPVLEDFDAMYPPSYQEGINNEIISDPYKKVSGIRYSYGKQFDLINRHAKGKRILDYGCGNANFLINAKAHGFDCDGTEYNYKHLSILKNNISGSNFYHIEEFLLSDELKYDVIRLSNVLEHLTNPKEIVGILSKKLTPGGVLLIEGPIENNFSISLAVRKLYFRVKQFAKKIGVANHVPTHIFYSNSKNQLDFFEDLNLQTLCYELEESEWPFPEKWSQAKGVSGVFMYVVAKFSIFMRVFNSKWGNTFIYVGRPK